MRNLLRRLRIPLVLTALLLFTVAAGAAPASACGTRSWRVVNSPNVWAVGYPTERGVLIEHWNGMSWRIVASPNVGVGNDILWAVARVPGTHQAWAIGTHSGATYQTLTEYEG